MTGRRFIAASPLVFASSPLCVFALKLLKKCLNRQATQASFKVAYFSFKVAYYSFEGKGFKLFFPSLGH